MKKGLCLLMVLAFCMMSMLVSCDKTTSGGLEFHTQGDGTCSVKGTNCQGNVVVPDVSPNGEAVTHIWGFFDCDGLQSITIPASVTSINSDSFAECPGLKSITVAEDNPVFHSKNNCIIETESNTLIVGCRTSIIPDYVISIGSYAFDGCVGLKSITIPAGLTNIERYAIINCPDLKSIIVAEDNPVYHSQDDCLIETETNTLVLGCKNSKIPDYIMKIGRGAFAGCTELITVKIPDSVREIGAKAFENCSKLKKIHIPASVENMYFGAFKGCSDLNSITVAEENTVFYSVDNCLIITSSGIMMMGCKNSKIPDSVTEIGSEAFSGCTGLKSVTIPNSVTEIGSEAFSGCTGLKSVTIPNSVTEIGSGAFSGCMGLKSVTIPDGVTEIGFEAFTDCTRIIEVKDGVHIVDGWIVGYDETVSSVILSEIRGIGEYAFQDCVGVTDITLSGSFTTIGNFQFNGCSNLTQITIPQGVTSIGEGAFGRCTSLEQINIPEGVTCIGESAFYECSALKQITIPGSVTSFGEYMFTDCMNLKHIYYTGTEDQWASYNIGPVASNNGLARATIHYNYVPEE